MTVNPICILRVQTEEEAMEKCKHLYNACDAVIFCDGWDKSKGCNVEFQWARRDGKPIYFYYKGELREYQPIKSEELINIDSAI